MKILLILAALLVAAAAGAAGAALFAPPATSTSAPVEPAKRDAPSVSNLSLDAEKRIDALSMEVADLEAQIRELRTAAARSAVIPDEVPKTTTSAAPLVASQREQILQVIADEKAADERRREEERLKREEENRLQRADRQAQRFGLNEAQERQLADYYLQSKTKLDEVRESMRAARESGAMDGEQLRTAMRDARDWSTQELERLFGPDTGRQIAESEIERYRGGGFGGGGSGGDGGGGNRPARREQNGAGGQGGGASGG